MIGAFRPPNCPRSTGTLRIAAVVLARNRGGDCAEKPEIGKGQKCRVFRGARTALESPICGCNSNDDCYIDPLKSFQVSKVGIVLAH